MLRLGALAAGLAWMCCMAASAQPAPNPIVQHYRAYQAALDANDLAGAEREAAAALAASEARDGDGGRTAVLSLNLASVRFLNNNAAGAVEPGRRALAISRSVGEARSNVSPVLAQLIVGRAELAAGDATAAARLASALEAAQEARLDPAEIYDAAVDLGAWTFIRERFAESRQAWSVAAEYADGSRFGAQFSRANALTGGAAAMFMEELRALRRNEHLSEEVASDAWQMLNEALVALRPLAEMNTEGEVTLAQRAYAQSLAWRSVLSARLQVDGLERPVYTEAQGDADGLSEVDVPGMGAAQPRCLVNIRVRNVNGIIPGDAIVQDGGAIAGLAIRYRINDSGGIDDIQTLAIVGSESFAESVERRYRNWRVERREDSPANCRMAMSVIRPMSFVIE